MSFESPLVRLNRDLREFARPDPQPASTSASMDLYSEADITIGNARTATADETIQATVPALGSTNTRVPRTTVQNPNPPPSLRRNPATPARNPYLLANTDPRDWSGIVDLRSPQPATPSVAEKEEDLTLPAGMSPPVMVPFATLPSLGRSPAKNAAANIRHALVRDVLRAGGGDPSVSASGSGGSMPTPPSLSRYARDPSRSHSSANLGPELHPQHWWQSSATSVSGSSTSILDNESLSTPSYYTTTAAAQTYTHEAVPELPETPLPLSLPSGVESLAAGGGSAAAAAAETTPANTAATESDDASTSTFSSSGEDDSVHNTAHPSAAFLLASRQRGRHDYDDDHDDDDSPDDGGDDFDDSLLGADVDGSAAAAARAPVHPFARARAQAAAHGGDAGDYDDYDDSFDSFDSGGGGGGGDEGDVQPEETVFGIRPAGREGSQPELRMLGEGVLQSQDTTRIRTRLPWVGRGMEESPTPWGDGGGARGG
jgi:DASH complex subunit ASK1